MTQNRISPVTFPGNFRFHLGLTVADLDASIAFYQRLFDQEPTKVKPGYAKFEPHDPSINFTLNQSSKLTRGNALSHMGIQLKDTATLDAFRARLTNQGLKDELGTTCCFALQDKFWIKDPDGNDIEFFVVLEKDADHQPSVARTACCAS